MLWNKNYRVLLTAGNTVEYFKNARTRSLTNIDIMISIIPVSVFKVKKIIIVSKINRFKSARIGGVVITMFEFVIYLKALATILITNSHFDTIYPISQLSMGGSIGNSIFFWVSGFCLSNIKSRGSIVVDGGGLVFAQIVENISSMRGCCFNKYFLQIYDTYSNP